MRKPCVVLLKSAFCGNLLSICIFLWKTNDSRPTTFLMAVGKAASSSSSLVSHLTGRSVVMVMFFSVAVTKETK